MSEDKNQFMEEIKTQKSRICSFLDDYLDEWEAMDSESRWRSDVKERMQEMAKGGKMVRGSLVIIIHDFYGGENEDECLKVSGAIELLHTGLLMHDDIVDKDDYRRGMPSFNKQYRDLAKEEDVSEEKHVGTSMAITSGDIAFFMGQGLLSQLDIDPKVRKNVINLVFTEFSSVGLAEQVDIYTGYSNEELNEEQIFRLYRDKTARYTFSLPFKAGAMMAGAEDDEIKKLYDLGEKIGIIFQLKDDELGLFSTEEETGKSLGSDLEENKKTLHRLKLLEKLPEDERQEMRERLRTNLSREDKREIVEMIEEKGIREEVTNRMKELAQEAEDKIEDLNIDNSSKRFLKDLTTFCLERTK